MFAFLNGYRRRMGDIAACMTARAGRPILAAADPRAAAQEIVDEIAAAKS